VTDTEQILKAIERTNKSVDDKAAASERDHSLLKAEIMKAIPNDHIEAHKKLDAFMGRLDSNEHLNHHEFIAPWQHTIGVIKDQIAKNVGNVLSAIVGIGGIVYLLQLLGVLTK